MVFELRHYQGLRWRRIGEILRRTKPSGLSVSGDAEDGALGSLYEPWEQGLLPINTSIAQVRMHFALLLYGELADEERVDAHLDGCSLCRLELVRGNRWRSR